MKENHMVCNCKKVSYSDIVDAVETSNKFDDDLITFESVQKYEILNI